MLSGGPPFFMSNPSENRHPELKMQSRMFKNDSKDERVIVMAAKDLTQFNRPWLIGAY